MHEIPSRFRALSDMERIKWFGHDWYQICMEKIEKLCHENQISFHQCKGFLDPNLYPNHSIHKPEANPSAKNRRAAPKHQEQSCIFIKKIQNWKLPWRTIQRIILIPLACQDIIESDWALFHVQSTQNWYIAVQLFHFFCIILFHHSCHDFEF